MEKRKFDVVIIGAGTAGMGAARASAKYGVSIAMIEGDQYGATCARVGCMPSKLLIAAAEAAHAIQKAPAFGVDAGEPNIDGKAVMHRVRSERDRFVGFVIEDVETVFPMIEKFQNTAHFISDNTLELDDGTIIEASRIVIATGSRPTFPTEWKSELGDRLIVNDDVFYWDDLPESLAVFGGGVIGLELAQALSRLGVRVRLFGRGHGVGPLTDLEVRDYAAKALSDEFSFQPHADVQSIKRHGDHVHVKFTDEDGNAAEETFSYLLAATGRRTNTDNLGLENTTLPLDEKEVPTFDPATLRIGDTQVFIAGDANNEIPLLHEAADEGRIAGDNAARFPDVRARPSRTGLSVVFSDPQIAMSGLSLNDIKAAGIDYAVGEESFEGQRRSRVMLKNKGLLHVYGEVGTGRFLGAEMVGPAAEHIAHLLSWAIEAKRTVQDMLDSPFYHPVIEEGVRAALRDLNRQLQMGPVPVEQCLDCGPGA